MLTMVDTQTDSIQETISDLKCEIELRDNQLITGDDLDVAKQSLKTVERIESTDLLKILQLIDKLEQHLIKSLKGQLTEDNKKSQGLIGKMKKNYEDL